MNEFAYKQGCANALNTFKLSEWNWDLVGKRVPKDRISSDNGRRAYGVNFTDPTRPSRNVSQAFNSLNVIRNSDFLNDANQGMIGATWG